MRGSRPLRRAAACTAVSLVVAGLGAPAAQAVSTPAPIPEDPNQPPASSGPPVPPPGPIFGLATTGIGVLRVLPGTIPGDSIIDGQLVPDQSALELGMGLASAKADSEAYLAYERSVAEASPLGASIAGNPVQPPVVGVNQLALPDNAAPATGGIQPQPSPGDAVLKLGALQGSAHARWDRELGPCVSPISDATTSLAGASALNVLPALPDTPEEIRRALPAGQAAPGLDHAQTDRLRSALAGGSLGGLLSGTASGSGSLLSVPDAVQAHSRIELVDVPGAPGKAVRSTSTLRMGSVRLLAGTPQELRIDVLGEPKVTVTSTGDPATSSVEHTAPVLRVVQGGREIAVLDAAHPQADLPIELPEQAGRAPVIGDLASGRAIDLGVLRLDIGTLTQRTEGTQLRGDARLFGLTVLPGDALGMPDAALADVSFGEQTAVASAPEGGVDCGAAPAPAPAPVEPAAQAGPPAQPLAKTSGAYHAVPLFWTGAGLLLAGAVLVAAVPRRQR